MLQHSGSGTSGTIDTHGFHSRFLVRLGWDDYSRHIIRCRVPVNDLIFGTRPLSPWTFGERLMNKQRMLLPVMILFCAVLACNWSSDQKPRYAPSTSAVTPQV